MRPMPATDAFFLLAESRRSPMHVAGLNLFTLPKGAEVSEFLANLSKVLEYDQHMRPLFGEKIKTGVLGPMTGVMWEEDSELDIDYHLRHSALPKPGRYRELFSLVSRLHGQLLDRSRPLWELHLIEGLQGRQFASYFKVHHCAVDGVAAMRLLSGMFSTNARTRMKISPFSHEAYEIHQKELKAKLAERKESGPSKSDVKNVAGVLEGQLGGGLNVLKAMGEVTSVWMGKKSELAVPFYRVPRSVLSQRITGARRFVAQSWSMERIKAVGKAFDGTLNDAVLAMVAGGLRYQLMEAHSLPKQSLKAMAPVSLRAADDTGAGNAIGFLTADLATTIRDPERRFRRIKESMDAGKRQMQSMNRKEMEIYGVLTQVPILAAQLAGIADRYPAYSTTISNVPGPKEQRYWNGARLDGIYPVSIPLDGSAANFTLAGNYKNLDFGIITCRRSIPHTQHIIGHMEQALVDLEEAAGLRTQSGRRRKAATRAKAKAKPKAKPSPKVKAKTRTKGQ